MKITVIEAIPFEIPFRRPFVFASDVVTVADRVLVRVVTDEGIVGHAEPPPRPCIYGESQASIVAAIREWFSPALTGADPLRSGAHRSHAGSRRRQPQAKAAVDIAVWDVIGQSIGEPCHSLLGGYASAEVIQLLGLGSASTMVEEALRVNNANGITAFQVKVGHFPISIDVAACRVQCIALGDDVGFYLDANRGWQVDDALRALAALVKGGTAMLQKPGSANDNSTRRRTVERSPVPIVGDESYTWFAQVARLLFNRSCDMVSIKTSRTGLPTAPRSWGCARTGCHHDHVDSTSAGICERRLAVSRQPGLCRRPATQHRDGCGPLRSGSRSVLAVRG